MDRLPNRVRASLALQVCTGILCFRSERLLYQQRRRLLTVHTSGRRTYSCLISQ